MPKETVLGGRDDKKSSRKPTSSGKETVLGGRDDKKKPTSSGKETVLGGRDEKRKPTSSGKETVLGGRDEKRKPTSSAKETVLGGRDDKTKKPSSSNKETVLGGRDEKKKPTTSAKETVLGGRDDKTKKPSSSRKETELGGRDKPQPSLRPEAARAKSTLMTPLDKTMAARQTKIESLPPAEKKKQQDWAAKQLRENAGNCVAGFNWDREHGGYRCQGGGHKVTDELLAEGRGGFMQRIIDMKGGAEWCGPFYSIAEAQDEAIKQYKKEMGITDNSVEVYGGLGGFGGLGGGYGRPGYGGPGGYGGLGGGGGRLY